MFNAQENAWDAIDYGYIGPLLNTLVNKLLDYKWWWPCNLCFGLDENCLLCMHAWHDFSRFHPKILKHFCSFISVFWLLYVRPPSYSRVWNRCSPWNKRSLPFKNFHIRVLIHFYINQGIAVIFHFFSIKFFKK